MKSRPSRDHETSTRPIAEDGHEILKGIDLDDPRRRGARDHGAERLRARARSRTSSPGRPGYEVTQGTVLYDGKDLLAMPPEERAREGIFLAFQYPVEIPGVSNTYFLRTARERRPEAPRPPGARRDGLPRAPRREGEARRDGGGAPQARASTRASPAARRSGTRSSRWRSSTRSSRSSTRPTPASTSTRCASSAAGVERAPRRRARDARHHALPAPPQLHRPGRRPRPLRRADRQVGRQGARARARGEGLRLDRERTPAAAGRSARRRDDASSAGPSRRRRRRPRLAAERLRRGEGARARSSLQQLREDGLAAFGRLGFPAPDDEEWRYTNVAPARAEPSSASPRVVPATERVERARPRLALDARLGTRRPLRPEAAAARLRERAPRAECRRSTALPAGVRFEPLATVARRRARAPRDAPRPRTPRVDEHPFVALNTALLRDGVLVHVADGRRARGAAPRRPRGVATGHVAAAVA